jgi:DNA polymerase III subunit epsilon
MTSILVLDTETTGLPTRRSNHYSVSSSYSSARVIQVGAVLCDTNGEVKESFSWLIKPEGFTIPEFITNLTGITQTEADTMGVTFHVVAMWLDQILDKCSKIVMHNASFDRSVLAAECYRQGFIALAEKLFTKEFYCTMEHGKDTTKIPLGKSYKFPKLQELYSHFFHEPIQGAHNALCDALATSKCYFSMV